MVSGITKRSRRRKTAITYGVHTIRSLSGVQVSHAKSELIRTEGNSHFLDNLIIFHKVFLYSRYGGSVQAIFPGSFLEIVPSLLRDKLGYY